MTAPERSVRVLNAVLMNPPVGSGAASLRHLHAARRILTCDELHLTNLFSLPTRSVTDITDAGQALERWVVARESLARATESADEIVLAWGLGGVSGVARKHFRDQVTWFHEHFQFVGVDSVWMIGDQPRHPSRWHQYVSDRHGRTEGGAFDERIRSVLHRCSVRELVLK